MEDKNVKKALKLSIDENILKEAKENIPNLSKLFEETLKIVLQSQNKEEYKIKLEIEAKEQARTQIDRELEVLNAQLNNHRNMTNDTNEAQEFAWRKLYSHYQQTQGNPHPKIVKESSETLQIEETRLLEFVNEISIFSKEIGVNQIRNWEHVKKVANQYVAGGI
ncbi:MAG: type II toxin-antitoxin system CcdA family antitoxin [Burkholderiaceae bacterium]|nr:type II toxin-antitoxin system CcdA family antitoxin [Burkholderiaceae bacterium]